MEENNALIEISKAQQALERANDIHEIMDLRDKAMAMQLFANAQGFKDAAQEAKIYQLKAERKAGDWLRENVATVNEIRWQDATRLPDGVDKYESHRWQLEASVPEPVFNEWVDDCLATGKEISAGKLQSRAKEIKRQQIIDDLPKDAPKAGPQFRLIHGDFQTEINQIDEPIRFIVTDPPYPFEYLHLYGDLSRVASNVMVDGGLVLAMAGQSYLPKVIELLGSHLTYHWTLSYLTPGGQSPQIFPRKVNTFWKPVLAYTKGDYMGDWFGDVCKSAVNDNDKRFHGWGQSESGMADLIERFTKPGDLIVDPFCGGGTTGIVALNLGRRFAGIDIDEKSINITAGRIAEWIELSEKSERAGEI